MGNICQRIENNIGSISLRLLETPVHRCLPDNSMMGTLIKLGHNKTKCWGRHKSFTSFTLHSALAGRAEEKREGDENCGLC